MGPLTGRGLTRGSALGNGPLQAYPGEGLRGLWTSFVLTPSSVLAPPATPAGLCRKHVGVCKGGG